MFRKHLACVHFNASSNQKNLGGDDFVCLFCFCFFWPGGGGAGGRQVVWRPSIFFLAVVELDGLDLFSNLRLALNLGLPVVSLQSRFYTSRVDTSCKKFHVLGLKNEEYSPKM